MEPSSRQPLFEAARRRAGLSVEQLWLDYLALGGEAGLGELESCLQGLTPLRRSQQQVLAHALYEQLTDLHLAPLRPQQRIRVLTTRR